MNFSFSNNLTPYPECWGLIAQREIITENNDSTDFLKVGSDYTLLYFTAQNVKDFEVKVIFIYNDTVLVEFNNGFLKLVSKSVLGPLQKTEKDLFIETFNNDFNGISFLPSDLYDKGYRKTS